ncbi:MAG: hypothetical protein F4Z25_01295 [Chloroflexi bacterium]|nr:hypothetical protein [Chloroflexota bacterium]MYJ76121.1 hypothetical protein [Gammaproteobacteria bacterium]
MEAVTRVFATLNTTGQRLTPFEIVVALLWGADEIDLRSDVEEYFAISDYLAQMDSTGEIVLQTIALLAGESLKKSLLPRVITADRYHAHIGTAVEALENLGEFLTERLGVGLDATSELIPYDSIFPPMSVLLMRIQSQLSGSEQVEARRKLEKWFVCAPLDNRYQEGVHNKQQNDVREVWDWVLKGEDYTPEWIDTLRVPSIRSVSVSGAIGRLLKCIVNAQAPRDPIEDNPVGWRPGITSTEVHHLFPKRFCSQHLAGWDNDRDNSNVALNTVPVTRATNRQWAKDDPQNQVNQIKQSLKKPTVWEERLKKLFISPDALAIMGKPDKTREDFLAFIEAREQDFFRFLTDNYDLEAGGTGEVLED